MAEGNGNYDWNERLRRIEDALADETDDHKRLNRNIEALRASMIQQKENIDNLLIALRQLIDRIPPENLRQGT